MTTTESKRAKYYQSASNAEIITIMRDGTDEPLSSRAIHAREAYHAPDLLTALEGLVAYADHYTTTDHGDCTCPHCVARAAIAKAKAKGE